MSKPRIPASAKAIALGQRIASAREQKGYTQDQLALRIGVTKGAVGQYEVALTVPRPHRLEKLAKELEVSVQWLLTGDEPDELVRAQTLAEKNALTLLRSLGPREQAAALAMLRGLQADKPEK